MPHSPPFATIAIALFSAFLTALIVLHGLRPDYTPVDHMISDYAVGRFGTLMTAAFVAVGLGCLSLALALWRDGPQTVTALVGRLLMIVACFGLMVTAAFKTDLETAKDTWHGTVHAISFRINIFSLFIAALCLSLSFGADARWKSLRTFALALTGALVIAFVAQIMTLHRGLPYGITNRLFVIVLIAWLLMVASRARTIAKGT